MEMLCRAAATAAHTHTQNTQK